MSPEALPLPPALGLIAAGLLLALIPRPARPLWLLGVPALVLGWIWLIPEGSHLALPFLGHQLEPLRATDLTRVFATVFALMALVGNLFALRQKSTWELAAANVYAGGAIGVTFAGDLISLFVFWEVMAVASAGVIWSTARPAAYRAGMRYLQVHLLGGVILMAGIIGHIVDTGSIAFTAMQPETVATWLILIGVLINAGAPPLTAWLPDAYPEASFSGTVFLSAFTTKTAVYVLIAGFPGTQILIWVGMYMVFYGIIYALLENDMRRILAYSIINQVGFMVCGVGIGTEMALNGAASHAFTHIIYKALLLMSAGSVLYMTGRTRCTELGGLFRSMPLTCAAGIIGALAISSFPLTSGFISKSMIAQGAADEHLAWVWMGLEAASAGVFLHAGIKFPWFVFFQRDRGLRPPDPPLNMKAAMVIFSAFCLGLGLFPQPLYAILPFPVDYLPYTTAHVVKQLQLLLFAGLAFFVLLPLMKRTETISLDWDWLYRRPGPWLARHAVALVGTLNARLGGAGRHLLARLFATLERGHGPSGTLARTWRVGNAAVAVMVLLCLYLAIYYY